MLPRRYAAIVPALVGLVVFVASSQQTPQSTTKSAPPARTTPPAKTKSKVGRPLAKSGLFDPAAKPEEATARALLNSMTMRDRIAQLVLGVAYGDVYSTESDDYKKYHHWI